MKGKLKIRLLCTEEMLLSTESFKGTEKNKLLTWNRSSDKEISDLCESSGSKMRNSDIPATGYQDNVGVKKDLEWLYSTDLYKVHVRVACSLKRQESSAA